MKVVPAPFSQREGPAPEMRRATSAKAAPNRNSDTTSTDDLIGNAPEIQARLLVERFGFAVEVAAVIASLAWGIAR